MEVNSTESSPLVRLPWQSFKEILEYIYSQFLEARLFHY
jgi:hypothetical protein